LDVLGLLATIEINFEGNDHGDGTASGELSISAIGVAGGGTINWEGTYSGGVLTIPIDSTTVFVGNSIDFTGTLTAL
jgi:hypothetical protein